MIRKLLLAAALVCAPTLAVAQTTYPTPAGSRVNGVVTLQCDASATNCAPTAGGPSSPSSSATAGTTNTATTAAAGSLVVKASPGNLYQYNVTAAATAGYILIYNRTTAPADGAVTPVRCIPLAANAGIEVMLRGSYFATGIVIVFSSTGCFTQTTSATAFIGAEFK